MERKITSDTGAAGRTVKASEEEPQYLVRSEKGGGDARARKLLNASACSTAQFNR